MGGGDGAGGRGRSGTDTRSGVQLRSAICVYLFGERQGGATVGEIARLTLDGLSPSEEVPRVSDAVSQLLREGKVRMEGEKVCPASTD